MRDDTPIIDSGLLPDFLRNKRLPDLPPDVDGTTADLKALLTTNSDKLSFRVVDLESMDERTKKFLLIDVYRALGIKPLREAGS